MVVAAQMVEAAGTRFHGSSYGLLGLVAALLFAFACRAIAKHKGRSHLLWFVLGFFFHILTLIVIALLPSKRAVAY